MNGKPSSFRTAKAVTESDDTEHLPADAIYVGSAGNLVVTINGVDVTFTAIAIGVVHYLGPITKVKTGSTAGALVLLYH
jgi:hypothetical protein